MAQNVSPGVYTKIIDLSEYVRNVPSTIGFIPIICEQGPDNQLIFTNARDFFLDFGEPDISYATKTFGQGPYICNSFLRESDSLYVIRCLPDEADFANLILTPVGSDSTAEIQVSSKTAVNSMSEIETILVDDGACCIFYGTGRGEFYNKFQIKISRHINPQLSDPSLIGSNDIVYILDIYQQQTELGDNGEPQYEIITSFDVSFNPRRLDLSGESMFVEDVVNRFSRHIKCITDKDACRKAVEDGADFSIPFIGDPLDDDDDIAIGLAEGTSGGLFDTEGAIDSFVATQLLTKAYKGDLLSTKRTPNGDPIKVSEVLDYENYYFTIVLDGGYPTDVKTAGIYELIMTRKDCVGLIDNGDNYTSALALEARANDHTFNTKYLALYECYSRIYDSNSGRDIWISPIYHMANIVPYTDNVSELWWAPAGFNRATIATIKELRFSPLQGERDQFYLNQINPIVKFNVGYTVWGQLTTQKRPTALQDLNIVRLVLYIKRALEEFCKFYIFELNDSETWNAIAIEVNKFLKQIQNKRGLYNYNVDVGATEYEIKAKQVHVNVTLNPTRVVEQIHLNFFIV